MNKIRKPVTNTPQTLAEWYAKYARAPYRLRDWELLTILAEKEGKSFRWISKEFKIARNTIRKYTSQDGMPVRRPQPVRDQWRETVRKVWTYHSTQADGPIPTAKWVFALLAEQHGYRGSERTIRTLILELKEEEEDVAK